MTLELLMVILVITSGHMLPLVLVTCPCSSSESDPPPLFIGRNYHCESAYDDNDKNQCFVNNVFFSQ